MYVRSQPPDMQRPTQSNPGSTCPGVLRALSDIVWAQTDMEENFRRTTARIASNPATNDVLGGIGSAGRALVPGRRDA